MRKLVITFLFLLSFPVFSQDNLNNLFEVEKEIENDISGDIITYSMKIYVSGVVYDSFTETASTTIILFEKKEFPAKSKVNQLNVVYLGQSWIFIENIQIKIDDSLYTLAITPRNLTMQDFIVETPLATLTSEMVLKLKNCKSLIVQVNGKIRGKPITIDPKGIPAINDFY